MEHFIKKICFKHASNADEFWLSVAEYVGNERLFIVTSMLDAIEAKDQTLGRVDVSHWQPDEGTC